MRTASYNRPISRRTCSRVSRSSAVGAGLHNLIENAMKFTPASGSIEIEAEQLHAQAVVTVRDTGIGIRRELLERLFDMYAQAEPFGGFNGKGLGVGLNLVRQIVELHDGQVTAAVVRA